MKGTLATILTAAAAASAQLAGKVGPSTTRDAKTAKKVCNILEHGGVASATTDNSAALASAWNDCKAGGQVLIPAGSYGLEKWVNLSGGTNVSVNLEGIIYRITSGTADGTLITVQDTTDFELYSGNSKGAIQGYGFEFHKENKNGPGMLALKKVTSFSVHGLALVDSPGLHFTLDSCTNGEVYNMIIRGGARAGLDGIDVFSTNIWIHDVEVSNGDECVTVKSPSQNILIESVFCNRSGGCSIGVLGADTLIRDITYQNVYTQGSDHMMLIKSNGGTGFVRGASFNNFQGHGNNLTLKLDAYWPSTPVLPGDGIDYYSLWFSNWTGSTPDGVKTPPIQLRCSTTWLCGDMVIEDFNVWTETGTSQVYSCQNAYGLGACMNQFAGNGVYSSATTVRATDAARYTAMPMPGEITQALGVTASIDIPAVPTTYYPGLKPVSPLLAQPTAA